MIRRTMMAQQNVSACSLLKQQLRAWAKGKSFVVRCHASVVADNLRLIEREGMPTDPVMIETFMDNIERLAAVNRACR